MHTDVVIQALTGVGAFVVAVGLGICIVMCARSHFSEVSARVRQFLGR